MSYCDACEHLEKSAASLPCSGCDGGDAFSMRQDIPELESKVKELEAENAHFRKILQDLVDLPLPAYRNKPIELIADVSEIQEAAKMPLRGPSPA